MIKFHKETEFKKTEIGEIPREWEVRKLGAIVGIKHGFAFSSKNFKEQGEIPVIKIQNIKEDNSVALDNVVFVNTDEVNKKLDKFYLKDGDILIALTGATAGKIGTIKGNYSTYLLNQRVGKFEIIDGKTSLCFVFYCLINKIYREWLLDLADGSAQGNMSPHDIGENVVVPYPSPTEQSRIATVLSWFDDMIENKKRQNEILEKTAMAIFKSWFVDFEPFQDEEFVYNEELDREMPKEWEIKTIGEVANFVKGLSYHSNELVENTTEGEIFITLKIFKRGGGFRPEYKYYNGNRYSDNQVVYNSDLVIALTDMTSDAKVVGAPALVILPPNNDKGILSLDAVKVNVPQYMKEYTYLYLKVSQEENSTFANGVNVLHLNLELFKTGKDIPIPPQPILEKFHSLVESLFQNIILNQKEIMVLRRIRDALLPQLVFGKLRVVEL